MLVTIIIPCNNSENTISDCLNSIKKQTFKKFEIKIIDNLSSDQTLNCIKKFHFENIEIISEKDNGIYDAINKGILNSKGEIISVLHSDDLFFDEHVLSNIVEAFIRNKVEIVYGNLIYVKRNNLNKTIRFWKPGRFYDQAFLKGWSPPHPSFFVKKKLFNKFGTYNLEIGNSADIELMYRFMQVFHIKNIYIDKVFVKMRYGGVSNNSLKNILLQNYSILKFLKINKNFFKSIKFFLFKLINRAQQILKRNEY